MNSTKDNRIAEGKRQMGQTKDILRMGKYWRIPILCFSIVAGSLLFASFNTSIGVTGASPRTNVIPPTYSVTDLGVINTTGQMISHPAGINESGQVTGYSRSGTSIHAARFTNGVVEDLGTIPGGDKSTGVGINDLGQVAGDSEYSPNGGSIRHAALFSNGTVTDIGFLPLSGNYARGNGINNQTVIVGHSGPDLDTSNTRAFIWDAALGMRDIGTLGGPYAKAFSINDSGMVTGEARTGGGFGDRHAFIWSAAGGMRDIGTIAGGFSDGAFINENGHIAGTSTINGFDNREHAFLYDGTTMRDLGSLGPNHFFSDRSFGYGVNIHDHVVGSTYRPYDGGALYAIPFIYRDGQMFDLETLVDESGADYRLYSATGINDAGQIAVDAYKRSVGQYHAVLLTPNGSSTPTPTSTPTVTPTPCGTPTNFANMTSISIPASGTSGIAAPYPANIAVAALAGNVARVTVKLINFNHTYPDDVDILLVGPGGQNAIIMSDVGGAPDAVNVTLTLDDAALNNLPDTAQLTSGTFKPTNIGTGDPFPAPAPAPSGGSALSVFNGTNPNGTWSLYIVDDLSTDLGSLAGGWELNITTDNCGSPTPTPTATPTTFSANNFTVMQGRDVVGGLPELAASDNTYLSILQNPFRGRSTPAVQVQFEAATQMSGASSIEFRLEANTSAAPAGSVRQRIDLFNFMTGQWTTVSETAASGSDFVQTGTVTSSASQYLEPGTGRLRSRASWFDPGTLLTRSWRVNIDHVSFTISP